MSIYFLFIWYETMPPLSLYVYIYIACSLEDCSYARTKKLIYNKTRIWSHFSWSFLARLFLFPTCSSVRFGAFFAKRNTRVSTWVGFCWIASFCTLILCVTSTSVVFTTRGAFRNTAISTWFTFAASFAATCVST